MKEISTENPGELQVYINQTLGNISLSISDAINEAITEVAKEATKKVKEKSPKGPTGEYKKGWRYKVNKARADGSFSVTIYNAKRGYYTHLIENGHPHISHGVDTGEPVKGTPHIAPVNDWVQSDGFQRITQDIEKAIKNTKT